jgi:hypothetical protein
MLATLLALFLASPFPAASKTAWMRPESFHLVIGMPRAEVLKKLGDAGWKTKPGKDASQLIIDYTDANSLTLQFRRNRLKAVRFEHFAFIPEARAAFAEETGYLRDTFGAPKKMKSKAVVLYDRILPNVMVVLSDDPKSENGKKGLGLLVVRYFDPLK